MRIGIMLRHLPTERGGIGRYTEKLLQNLLRIDNENEYFLLHKDANAVGAYANFSNAKELFRTSPSKFLWDQFTIPPWATELKLDVIFNPKISIPFRTRIKTVANVQGADWFEAPQNYSLSQRIYHRVAAPLYARKADAMIACSRDAADKLEQHVPALKDKIVPIHHGVGSEFCRVTDSLKTEAVRKKYQLPEHFILYVGQIYPMKNVSGIITAFSHLCGRIPHKLVIVGAARAQAEKELALIDRYNLEKSVILVGRVPDSDLPAIYSLASVFLFPSLYEGFGIPLLEAMACGCPVVTSVAGSCPEVVGNAAILVDPRDFQGIATATREVVTNRSLAQALSAKGLQRVKAFTWEKCARETLDVFEQVRDGKLFTRELAK